MHVCVPKCLSICPCLSVYLPTHVYLSFYHACLSVSDGGIGKDRKKIITMLIFL